MTTVGRSMSKEFGTSRRKKPKIKSVAKWRHNNITTVAKKTRLIVVRGDGITYRLVIALECKYDSFCTDIECSELSLSISRYRNDDLKKVLT